MLDIKRLREDTENVKAALARRKEDVDIDAVLAVDTKRREILFEAEKLKSRQNEVSKQIPALKKAGEDTTAIFKEMKELSEKIKEYDEQIRVLDEDLNMKMLSIPNIPNADVPDGDTDEDNVEIRRL